MREITDNLHRAHSGPYGGLVCPYCGDSDMGNRVKGVPWCMKCQLPLLTKEIAAKWVKPGKPTKPYKGYTEPDGVVRLRK
jgi:hypothetical protein